MGMMINRRRVCGSKSLPYDAEIEYLKSTGTQWIDTGYKPNANTKFEIRGTQDRTDSALFGLSVVFYCFSTGYYSTHYGFCGNNGRIATATMQGVEVFLTMSASDGIVINGTKHADITAGSTTANYPMTLFGRRSNDDGSVSKLGTHIIKSAKIYDGNTLVRDFIPVKVNNVGYMYDKVSGALFGNAGTGTFIAGPEV